MLLRRFLSAYLTPTALVIVSINFYIMWLVFEEAQQAEMLEESAKGIMEAIDLAEAEKNKSQTGENTENNKVTIADGDSSEVVREGEDWYLERKTASENRLEHIASLCNSNTRFSGKDINIKQCLESPTVIDRAHKIGMCRHPKVKRRALKS